MALVAREHRALCSLANVLLGREDISLQVWPDERFDLVGVFERIGSA